MEDNIIDEVKRVLGITDSNSAVQLCERLRQKLKEVHPDLFHDEEVKKEKEEEFKQYNELYQRLNKYIKDLKTTDVALWSQEDNTLFTYIRELDSLQNELELVKKDKQSLENQIKDKQAEVDRLNQQLDEIQSAQKTANRENLNEIYKPRTVTNIIGITAMVASIAVTIPELSNITTSIGLSSSFSRIIMGIFAIAWLLSWLRKYFMEKILNSIESFFLYCPDIESFLNIKEPTYSWLEIQFSEKDIAVFVRKQLKKWYRIVVVLFDYEKTVQILTEQIILELERKKLISNTSPIGFTRVFQLNKKSDY